MAAPLLTATYPSDNDVGIPIGISLTFQFDRGLDLETAKNSVVMYGADSDLTSGPDQAIWIDRNTGNNPHFLSSPGFKGLVPLTYKLVYVDLDTDAEVDPGTITSEADEAAYGVAGVGHKLIVTPENQLAADWTYTVFVLGETTGISSRTVFDVETGVGNVGTTGEMVNFGGYTRNQADRVIVEITTGGDIGTAQYRWYYTSAGVGTAVTGRVTSRRYRRLLDGLQIRFTGSGFVAGDTYEFNVEPIERLAANTQLSFTTNDGSYLVPPDSPSTPAPCEPPDSVLPPVGGDDSSSDTTMTVDESTPDSRAYNIDPKTNTFIVTFSDDIDPATVTDETVTIWQLDARGEYSDTHPPIEMSKKLTVAGNTLTIEI